MSTVSCTVSTLSCANRRHMGRLRGRASNPSRSAGAASPAAGSLSQQPETGKLAQVVELADSRQTGLALSPAPLPQQIPQNAESCRFQTVGPKSREILLLALTR